MCGIAGNISIKPDKYLAAKMAAVIKHRGPDDGPNVVSNEDVSIAAVRLSIVDVVHGNQPMYDQVGNIVALNGEIYNYKELRQELVQVNYTFKTTCDTEVLLAGFSKFGPEFVEKLDGIFAAAYYSKKERILYLFRDFFGVKPLHYRIDKSGVSFSSEVKSFWIDRRDYDINNDFLIYNKVFNWSDPRSSLYEGINTVVPATYIKITREGKIESFKYQPRGFGGKVTFYDQAVEKTREVLYEAVKSQIPEEVDWGVLLSGGVDSSVLAWNAAKASQRKIRTFSVSSAEMETEDLLNAREVARILGSEHTEIRIDFDDAMKHYDDYIYSVEDVNSRFFFYYFISRFLSGKVKVAICGEGADELYMGYPVYRELDKFIGECKERWAEFKEGGSGATELIEATIGKLEKQQMDGLYQVMIEDQLPYFQLNPVDKCSMRFGIELRVPYLSLRHAMWVMNYPVEYKQRGEIEKKILRDAFQGTGLPTIDRKKFFAGTRTLPSFYSKLEEVAKAENEALGKKYPFAAKVLNPKDLYALSVLDRKMKSTPEPDISRVSYVELGGGN